MGMPESFEAIQKANDAAKARELENIELKEKLSALEAMVERLNTIAAAAEVRRERGSSTIRIRRTQQ